ncbi:PAS domain-containing protein [Dyadobacter sp. CY345]|uniref:PAS domain-containing protein n=1 Tax=Dyadobacter sp. CY345 TaxID=2909335 RepID=UPI001F3D0138|nr:PAS domain-containing protein [Dyadobacter sp. CY345]MCF2446836.1 PAS domain-containing protein [Dyadobacter sp. CY345]
MNGNIKPFSTDNVKETSRLQLALRSAGIGTWQFDFLTDSFLWCDQSKLLYHFQGQTEDIVSFEKVIGLVYFEDQNRFREAFHAPFKVDDDNAHEIEFRVTSIIEGQTRWLLSKGQIYFDDNGNPEKIIGTVQNITREILDRKIPLETDNAEETAECGDQALILATEVEKRVNATQVLRASEEKFRSLVEEAPVATCLFVGTDHKIEVANSKMLGYWGKDKSILSKPVIEAIPEIKGQPFEDLLDEVYNTGITYEAKSAPADLVVNGVLDTYYFDYTYKPLRNSQGEVYAIMNMAHDVTREVHAKRSLEASEEKLRSVFANASAAMGLFVGRDLHIQLANQAFIEIIGKGPDIIGKALNDVIPELHDQASIRILGEVFDTGKPRQRFESQVNLLRDGVMTSNYYNITYTPLFDSEGKVYAILDIGIDVTETVLARQKLEESELFARNIIYNSPVAKMVFIGNDMVIRTVNENMLEMLGKTDSIIGKPFMEAVPELLETQLMDRLREVLRTGISYNQPEEKIDLLHNGVPYSGYYNYNYKALQNTAGENYGVLVTAIEVTAQVLVRQKIEEAEQVLRDAVELAELATWSINPETGDIGYGERMKEWVGVMEDFRNFDDGIDFIPDKDRERIRLALQEALKPEGGGIYEEEHMIENIESGKKRYIHSRAKTFFDKDNKPYKLIGIAQDITEQREIQDTLEQLVQQRTEELETMNEELAAINEEYMATNEDLAQSNHLLIQSNQSLQQFAYVASHDLQEPLRKIQSFGNLLINRYSEPLGDGANLILRMQTAAVRMSGLIEDLLAFSRISNQPDVSKSISLSSVLQNVLSDLEIKIQETEAVITVEKLPSIMGDDSQLGQLFQNLLSNALKFSQKDKAPIITVNCKTISSSELPLSVNPAQVSPTYYQIDVADNGIGFEQKYSERIFQLFQRLHGRSEFEGTGIGLSICERVASNHGGAISAVSEPGKGSTFSIFFPFS